MEQATQQIAISDAAQAHFRKLLDTQEEGTHIRIFVVNPGTPNAECGVSYCPPNAVEESDIEMKYNTFSAFIDEVSLPFLEEAEIDYVTEELGAQLTLKAPNAKMRKVADDAPLIERVEYVIQTQINPQLANHGKPEFPSFSRSKRHSKQACSPFSARICSSTKCAIDSNNRFLLEKLTP